MKNKMKEKMKTILLKPLGFLLLFLLVAQISFAQVAINEDDTDADAKAALDVKSTTKGVLLPNLSQTERDNLVSPATGLIIYNRTVGYFNYYNGTKWCRIERTLVLDPAINPTTTANDVGVGVGISDPDNSAILHVNANNKGMLIPRMASFIASPPQGLIFYHTTHNVFFYYHGTNWYSLIQTVEGNANTVGSNTAEGVVIGATTVDATAKLEVKSATLGVLFPRMTSAQRDLIKSPAEGLLIYNTTTTQFEYFTDNKWYAFTTVAPSVQAFSYTGAVQNWTVPAGVYTIQAKLWGAGGGGANNNNGRGGAGGYSAGYLTVTPGELLSIYVGGAGRYAGAAAAIAGGWNGGGTGRQYGGSGGGASDIRSGGTAYTNRIIVAGAGGGAARYYNRAATYYAGVGGGNTGGSGTYVNTGVTTVVATGGTQVAGGATGTYSGSTYSATPGGLGYGGNGGTSNYSGGGGAGYYGGGGGSYMMTGAGGSNYVTNARVFILNNNNQGSGVTPPNTGDADYSAGIGVGGSSTNGGNGRVVIRY